MFGGSGALHAGIILLFELGDNEAFERSQFVVYKKEKGRRVPYTLEKQYIFSDSKNENIRANGVLVDVTAHDHTHRRTRFWSRTNKKTGRREAKTKREQKIINFSAALSFASSFKGGRDKKNAARGLSRRKKN